MVPRYLSEEHLRPYRLHELSVTHSDQLDSVETLAQRWMWMEEEELDVLLGLEDLGEEEDLLDHLIR